MKTNNQLIMQIGLFMLLLLPAGIMAQNNLIPNTQDCSASRPPFSFSIQRVWISETSNNVHSEGTPLVGDLDGDSQPDVVAMSRDCNKVFVFDGKTGEVIGTINLGMEMVMSYSSDVSFPGLICDSDGDGKGEVFIVSAVYQQMFLYEVSSNPGEHPMTFSPVWADKPVSITTFTSWGGLLPVVADLEGDGTPEFVVEGQIVSSQTGEVLTTLPLMAKGSWGVVTAPYVADVDGDGLPEVIVGTDIYKYFASTYTLYARCPSCGSPQEGVNMVADINQDGLLDVVYSDSKNPTTTVVIWTPATNTEVGSFSFSSSNGVSYPFVGDIDGVVTDGKKYPEICINTANKLYAYSYNGSSFQQKWIMSHSDRSAATSITLYDFNLDGATELVYRDETQLRIIDGSSNTPQDLWNTPCYSLTTTETPIVADVTGDGSANIIVTGNLNGIYGQEGEVMVFEGGESKWASCPKVWNQQMYSNLLVNENLTIPDTIRQPHLAFTQTCPDKLGNVVQFYNGGPMQAPYVSNETYCPINLSPDVFIVNGNITILSATSVSITVTVGNQGLAVSPASTPIRYYQNNVTSANVLTSVSTTQGIDLFPGQTTTITQTITGLSPMPARFFVRLLDDGMNFPALGTFSDCDLTNNVKSFGTLELTKEVNQLTNCLNGVSVFTIRIKNNEVTTYSNIQLTDSLGVGWDFISATPSSGTTVGTYNPVSRSLSWTVPSLSQGNEAELIVVAQSVVAGSLRNYVWIGSINGLPVEKEERSAYVIVSNLPAPVLNDIADNSLCTGSLQPAITFSGSDVDAANSTWTNSNPNIGLAVSGTGNIPAFTVSNATGSSITATITVTPVSTGGCTGVSKSFTIEVTPAVVPTITIQAVPN